MFQFPCSAAKRWRRHWRRRERPHHYCRETPEPSPMPHLHDMTCIIASFRWFNDFLHNSEYERALAHARSESAVGGGDITVSVWSHVRYCRERYENVLWTEQRTEQGGGGIFGGEAASFSGDISGEGDPFCYSGVDAGVGETRAPDDEARLWRPGRRHLPPPLWPACGVRSLVVWQRAWACRGLEVRWSDDFPRNYDTGIASTSSLSRAWPYTWYQCTRAS